MGWERRGIRSGCRILHNTVASSRRKSNQILRNRIRNRIRREVCEGRDGRAETRRKCDERIIMVASCSRFSGATVYYATVQPGVGHHHREIKASLQFGAIQIRLF